MADISNITLTPTTPRTDLTGRRFGRLIVQRLLGRSPSHGIMWHCQCDCGCATAVARSNLISGASRSCGCGRREYLAVGTKTHGWTSSKVDRHPLYGIWAGMRSRCSNPNATGHHNYGGRGISICPEWDDFAVFAADMGPRPSLAHTLDRIDNDGNYTPANCRWATPREQIHNSRRGILLLHHEGAVITVAEAAVRLNLSRTTIRKRLKRGWSVERVLTTPSRQTMIAASV